MSLCQRAEGELCVGQLQLRVGLSQSALSQHLAIMREQKIVATRRVGQSIYYRISDPAALQVIATLADLFRSEEHTSELQSLMRISYAVFCLKKKNNEQKAKDNRIKLQAHHNHTDHTNM